MNQVLKELLALIKQNSLDLFPIRKAFKSYSGEKAWSDVRAGVNVALVAFPQSMAYALIAGLPIKYGLYGVAISAVIGSIFLSSRFLSLGPSNSTAVLIASVFLALQGQVDKMAALSLLTLMVGVILIFGAYLKAADLTKFVSQSVIVGYITGAALLIIANQVHSVLGYSLPEAATFFHVCKQTLEHVEKTQWPSLALGLATFGFYKLCNRFLKKLPNAALTLVAMSFVTQGMLHEGYHVALLDPIPVGEWPVTPPVLNMMWFSKLFSGALAIAFLTGLQGNSIAKSLSNRTGDRVHSNQDMLGFGVANIMSSFFCGMPAAPSLVRSGLNWTSGAVTNLANVICGIICAAGVLALGNFIGYIPKSSLAVIVICSATALIDSRALRITLKTTKSDAIVVLTTSISALLIPLDHAIYLGVAISITLFLRKAGSPQLVEYTFDDTGQLHEVEHHDRRNNPHVSIIHVEGDLFFGATDLFREEIHKVCRDPSLKVVILRLKNAHNLDATSVMALEELITHLRETGRHLLISGAMRDVERVLLNSGLIHVLGKENFFEASPQNPNISTRNALERAQELLGRKEAPVRIFYDPAHQKKTTAIP